MKKIKKRNRRYTTKDGRNLSKLKKAIDEKAIKDVGNVSKLRKENEATKDKIIRDVTMFFESENIRRQILQTNKSR